MINMTNIISGYKSNYQKQDSNNNNSTTRCTNTAHLYFHNEESLKYELIQQTDSCKINPGFYATSINSEFPTEKIAELVTNSIREFLKINPECRRVNVKFHSFDNGPWEKMKEVEEIASKNFPCVEIKATSKTISHQSLTESRLRNRMVRYTSELNKKPNLKYDEDFYVTNGVGRSAATSDKFFKEINNLDVKYRDNLSKNIEGMHYLTENTSLQYFYEGDDLSEALDKLVDHYNFFLY